MKINNIIKTTMLSGLLLASASCNKKPFVPMPQEFVPTEMQGTLDSLSSHTTSCLNDSFELIKKDTLITPKNFHKNPKRFQEIIDHYAEKASGRSIVGKETHTRVVRVGKVNTIQPYTVNKYENNYTDCKGVVKTPQFFTTDSANMYIPVEYYGIPNPNVKNIKK